MSSFKLLVSETLLEDDYPIVPSYVYIARAAFFAQSESESEPES